MRTLFLLNPTAGKADCTRTLPQQINAAAARAGLRRKNMPFRSQITPVMPGSWPMPLRSRPGRAGKNCGSSLPAATAPSTKHSPGSMAMQMQRGLSALWQRQRFSAHLWYKGRVSGSGCQLAGGPVSIDLMQTSLGLSATICAAGLDAQVAYGIPKFRRIPLSRRRDGLCAFHCGTAVRTHRPQGGVHHRW